MKIRLKYNGLIWHPVYEGEGEGEGGGGGEADAAAATKAAADKAAADKAAADRAAAEGGDSEFTRYKFTPEQQKFFNSKMSEEKKKLQAQNQKTIGELEKIKAAQGTTEQQRQQLQVRIDELQAQFLSKEEIARKDREKLLKEQQSERERLTEEAKNWKNRYTESTITRAIKDAAGELEAYNPEQIVPLLERNVILVEELDGEGRATGIWIPRAKIKDHDAEGKVLMLDMSVKDAVKRMKDAPDRYGNLFKGTLNGGLGQTGNTGAGKGKQIDPKHMTAAQYLDARKKDPNLRFTNRQ